MATLQQPLAPGIARFCQEQGVEDQLTRALALVGEHFPDAHALYADLVCDPDTPQDSWVSVTVELSGSLSEIVAREEQFVDHWITEISWPASDKIVVQLDIQ